MAAKLALLGHKVLVTRPEQQANSLCELIEQAGGTAIRFPVIDIKAVEDISCPDLSDIDVIIFVSRNAVNHFMAGIKTDLPPQLTWVAVGKGTAQTMNQQGLKVDLQPTQAVGSEGLLLLPEFEQVAGKNILVVRGKGGRELLADTLTARGAKISYLALYERCLPLVDDDQCQAVLKADSIVCTSVAGVTNLTQLLQNNIDAILLKPLLVLSERIKQHALSLGFSNVVVTDDASDQSIMQRLMEMEN